MKVIAVISRKGGAGKTTLSTHLAVAAEARGMLTAIVDCDPQASAALWSDSRGETHPAVVPAQAPRLPGLLAHAAKQNAALAIIDTPPEADSIAMAAAAHADLIIIPCRPSALDLNAIGASVGIARAAGKRCVVVVSAAPTQGSEVNEMREALSKAGIEVAPVVIHHRKAFSARMVVGRTALEHEPKGKAAGEIEALLEWACNQVGLKESKVASKLAVVGELA